MASHPIELVDANHRSWLIGSLSDAKFAIGGPRFDALCFWGVPVFALLFVQIVATASGYMGSATAESAKRFLVASVALLTFAHLIAVVPRAYLNTDVFTAYRERLTIIPVMLLAAMFVSPLFLVAAGVVAIFWDVHHSAMQTFGLARIYDMKAGNQADILRSTDLRVNWALYVGPIAAGASFMVHMTSFEAFDHTGWTALTTVPGFFAPSVTTISFAACVAVIFVVGWAIMDYRAAIADGYTMPVHKLVLMSSTGIVSILAWGLAPPVIAFASINIFHAIQYFALVWLKEGPRMTARTSFSPPVVLFGFVALCAVFGIGYQLATMQSVTFLLAPFVACSLLHFWFDSFIWSVRKKQV